MGIETFGEALRRLRGEMSIREAAGLANVGKSYVSDLENGRRTPSMAIATALDRALGARGELVALVPSPPNHPSAQVPPNDEWEEMSDLLRRAFLKRGLAAITLPAIGLEELKHIAAAINDARRYADREVVLHLERPTIGATAQRNGLKPQMIFPCKAMYC